jgi:nondiscriminating aspartyl-tRNA synthetase
MQRTLACQTINKIDQKVRLAGWVNNKRDHGKITFIDLRDRSGIVQVVGSGRKISKIGLEYVIEVEGRVKRRPENLVNSNIETGEVEVEAEKVKIIAKADDLPFDMSKDDLKLNLPTLLDNRALTLRHPKIKAIFKVEETIIKAFRKALQKKEFTEFEAPTIVAVATEGGAEVFPISYYDHPAYLGQSPQLYKQMMVSVFERVYTVGRAYRAEPSVTTRHLSEYITLDCEFGFIDSWTEIMDMAEYLIKEIFLAVEKNCQKELEMYHATLPKLSEKIPRLKLREAQEIIYERTGRDNRKEPDLEPEDEREICKWALEKKDTDLVFITHFPTKKRPFYTYPDPEEPEFTYSFDLLGRGLEWITGGQRINDYKKLLSNIKKWKLNPNDFSLYLQAFKYGMPPEGGFALGAERITMQILGLKNIREASLFPRDMQRVDVRLSALNAKGEKK